MKTRSIIFLFLLSISFISINAQDNRGSNRSFDLEKFKQMRADFFRKELKLTPAEEKAFIPLVNELMEKKFQINRKARDTHRELMKKSTKTAADYNKAIDASLESRIQEAQIQKHYIQKFKTVLPAEKVYKYFQAEMKFMDQAVEQHRGQERTQGQRGNRSSNSNQRQSQSQNKK